MVLQNCLKLHLGGAIYCLTKKVILLLLQLVLNVVSSATKKELGAILWDANELLREARNNGASKRVRG